MQQLQGSNMRSSDFGITATVVSSAVSSSSADGKSSGDVTAAGATDMKTMDEPKEEFSVQQQLRMLKEKLNAHNPTNVAQMIAVRTH